MTAATKEALPGHGLYGLRPSHVGASLSGDPREGGEATDTASVMKYVAFSSALSAAGGGLVGYAASSDFRGAGTGALVSVGFNGLVDAFLFTKRGVPAAAVTSGLVGVGGLAGGVFLAMTRKGRRRR